MENSKTKNSFKAAASGLEMLPVEEMKKWYNSMQEFGKEILKVKVDYGVIPGVDKPALLKPGAEKLKKAFGLQVESLECIKEISDPEKNYIDYTYKCIITTKSGLRLGICDGNANSSEPKYKYVFIPILKTPSKEDADKMKALGLGRWRKSGGKWFWCERKINPNVTRLKNTVQKLAQKRAFVGAVLMATGASEFFTQDAESVNN